VLNIQGGFKDDDEALQKAKGRLNRANKATITRSITAHEEICFTVERLEFVGSLDDAVYGITKVSHEFSSGGFIATIEFEN